MALSAHARKKLANFGDKRAPPFEQTHEPSESEIRAKSLPRVGSRVAFSVNGIEPPDEVATVTAVYPFSEYPVEVRTSGHTRMALREWIPVRASHRARAHARRLPKRLR
jgi:hypothetical protein